jgi:GDPmannose 4,6-dehydratase
MGIADDIDFVDLDLIDQANIRRAIEKLKPDIVYNLAVQSFLGRSSKYNLEKIIIDMVDEDLKRCYNKN